MFVFFAEGWTKDFAFHRCPSRVSRQHRLTPLHTALAQGVLPWVLGGSYVVVGFFFFNYICLFVCYFMCLHAHMPQCMFGGQSGSSPPTKCVLGIEVTMLATSCPSDICHGSYLDVVLPAVGFLEILCRISQSLRDRAHGSQRLRQTVHPMSTSTLSPCPVFPRTRLTQDLSLPHTIRASKIPQPRQCSACHNCVPTGDRRPTCTDSLSGFSIGPRTGPAALSEDGIDTPPRQAHRRPLPSLSYCPPPPQGV